MAENKKLSIILAVLLMAAALISFFGLSKAYSNPETFAKTVSVLDEEKNTVAKLSAASFAAAAAIDLIPGEAGKSVSDALVDLGGYFVLIFAAIYLEKILLAIGGVAAFKILVPIGWLILALFILLRAEPLKKVGIKLITFGLVVFLLVPASVWISQRVEGVYEAANGTSVQETIDSVDSETNVISENVEEDGNAVQKLLGKAKNAVTGSLDKFNDLLDNMIETVAFFIVTTCVLPIVVLLLMILLLNQLTGANINVGAVMKAPLSAKKKIKKITAEANEEE